MAAPGTLGRRDDEEPGFSGLSPPSRKGEKAETRLPHAGREKPMHQPIKLAFTQELKK